MIEEVMGEADRNRSRARGAFGEALRSRVCSEGFARRVRIFSSPFRRSASSRFLRQSRVRRSASERCHSLS